MTHQITKADRTAWQGLLIQAPQHIKQCLLSLHHRPAQLQAQACPILEGTPVGTDMQIIIGNSTCHHLCLSQTYAWVFRRTAETDASKCEWGTDLQAEQSCINGTGEGKHKLALTLLHSIWVCQLGKCHAASSLEQQQQLSWSWDNTDEAQGMLNCATMRIAVSNNVHRSGRRPT